MAWRPDLYSPLWAAGLFLVALLSVGVMGRMRAFALPKLEPASRFGELDGLRGVLAFAVFLTHAASTYRFRATGQWAWPDSSFYTLCGYVPVSLFFMITGFLFWRRAIERKLEIKTFLIGRVFRVVPLYMVALLALLAYVATLSNWTFREAPADVALEVARWTALVIFGRPDINGVAQTWVINPAIWTLRPEALFYLALPLVAVFATAKRFLLLAIVAVGLAVGTGGVGGGDVWMHFLFGMAAAHLHLKFPEIQSLKSQAAAAACLILLIVTWAVGQFGYGLSYAAFSFPIFLCVLYGNDIFGLLKITEVRWLGEISYSIYLLHGLVLFGLFWIFDALTPIETLNAFQFWSLMSVVTVCVVALSILTFLCVEAPFMRRRPLRAPAVRLDLAE